MKRRENLRFEIGDTTELIGKTLAAVDGNEGCYGCALYGENIKMEAVELCVFCNCLEDGYHWELEK